MGAGFYFVFAEGDPTHCCTRSFHFGCVVYASLIQFSRIPRLFASGVSMASFSDIPGFISPAYAAGFFPSVLWPSSVASQLTSSATLQLSLQEANLALWASFDDVPLAPGVVWNPPHCRHLPSPVRSLGRMLILLQAPPRLLKRLQSLLVGPVSMFLYLLLFLL